MYCICADDGGGGGAVDDARTGLVGDVGGVSKQNVRDDVDTSRPSAHVDVRLADTTTERPAPIGGSRRETACSACPCDASTSGVNLATGNGVSYTRRRRSLVEALSNPLPPSLLMCRLENDTVGNDRPCSSVLVEQQDTQNRLLAVQELLRCERDYVTLLADLIEGFFKPACRRTELFDVDSLRAIFGNLRQIRALHERLLEDLEKETAATVCLGKCVIQHMCTKSTFEAYSHYCNNHQRSCRRLAQLYENPVYRDFFEECRVLCRLPALRLDAFLLRPVQQLCRYPLLLSTVLQKTPKSHPDHGPLTAALHATQHLLTVVNNRRRLFEQLQELAVWQKSVLDWKGADLLQTSSRLVFSGELNCACYFGDETLPRWRKRVVGFLFDRLLILCTKDRLKKQLVFKMRFDLDANRASLLNGGVWQLTVPSECKRLLLKANSRQEAKLWLEALNKERFVVQSGKLPSIEEKFLAMELAQEI